MPKCQAPCHHATSEDQHEASVQAGDGCGGLALLEWVESMAIHKGGLSLCTTGTGTGIGQRNSVAIGVGEYATVVLVQVLALLPRESYSKN